MAHRLRSGHLSAHSMEFFCNGPLNLYAFDNKRLYLTNRRWWNNETICIVLQIIQRYFSSKKIQQKCLVPKCRKLIKIFYNFNLFYVCFSFGRHVFIGISSFRVCGVLLWLGSGRKIILLHTHVHTKQYFTNNFSLHTTPLHTWPTLKNFLFIRDIWWYLTAGRLITGCWVVWFQVWHPWLVLKTSLIIIYMYS
jgi:hypothetical protein